MAFLTHHNSRSYFGAAAKRACKIVLGKLYDGYDNALYLCQLDSLADRREDHCHPGQVRLVGGRNSSEGRVEIFYNNTWGRVCSFDNVDAMVVCRQLGLPPGNAEVVRYAHMGTGPMWLYSVRCSGSENSLDECDFNKWGVDYCLHDQDAWIICHKDIQMEFMGHCYEQYPSAINYWDAKSKCEELGANLVSINTPLENEKITDTLENQVEPIIYWIGLDDIETKDEFVWGDGTVASTNGTNMTYT
ncbi:galectin-3-binding protein-like, partial [Amphiura filiformis]|uniref:galectin-3-binding protein-like n=1 Tax=Amphiura filiformis TaxID=82378 RepID=UPI003B22651E